MSFRLAEIPVEVLLDNFLPLLPVLDLLNLGSTNRLFYNLCNDDTFWKRKIQEDFNFPCDDTARRSGWKIIYRGLSHPHTYVWGEASKGRLGMAKPPRSNIGDAPWPLQLRIGGPGARIVNLSAAGMSFFAMDSKGALYAWGTLDGTTFDPRVGYSAPGKIVTTPMRLNLPVAMRTISCGRLHATTLDENLHVWTFLSFGRPFRLVTPFLDGSSPSASPHQVVSGWSFSAVLTKTGDVYVWFPWGDQMSRGISERNIIMDQDGQTVHESELGVLHCVTWELEHDPHKLPNLPSLPPLTPSAHEKGAHLIKIAALGHHIVGLTNYGHVLKIALQEGNLSTPMTWEYLPLFSDPNEIKERVISIVPALQLPDNIKITHISAQFKKFVAYSTGSSSVVLMGTDQTTVQTSADVVPVLQNRNVISLIIGDYHYGALTSTGKLLTWGDFARGALGLGDPTTIEVGQPGSYSTDTHRQHALEHGWPGPPPLVEPAEVRFDHHENRRRERFCFAATAAGWHTGALVIDLEPDQDDQDEDTGVRMPGGFPPGEGPTSTSPSDPTGLGHRRPAQLSIFRVGFAGRGRGQG
ncbi:regulator of chromosome condensation 1/beta-lactamase-inhibitor protein II [Scleroderma citrinum]